MYKITKCEIEQLENPGCTNGQYPDVRLEIVDSNTNKREVIYGNTCRCHHGCSNTWRLSETNMNNPLEEIEITDKEFKNMSELMSYLED